MANNVDNGATPFTLRSFLVCDDVRTEASGKDILIGVYADALIVPRFPARVGKLVFRVTVANITLDHPKGFVFQITDTKGGSKAHVEQPLPDGFPKALATIVVAAHGLKFESSTELTAKFGIDCVPVTVGKLAVREPNSDEERRKVAAARS